MLSPPTVWRQKSLFRADSLARYLLQCAKDSSVVALDKTVVGLNVATRFPAMYTQTDAGLLCCVGSGFNVAVP
jgi:hypothetical protein